ncbi:MAG: hypothetical protein FJX72_19365, partial [Armatimonadetes bacterium]|nr:hypothetical protein [Armatimonadota bacterium]
CSRNDQGGASAGLPVLRPEGGGRLALSGLSLGHRRGDIARGIVGSYTERFAEMLASVTRGAPITRLAAAGGASRSADWLAHLGRRVGMPLQPVAWEHAGLAGIARIVTEHEGCDP